MQRVLSFYKRFGQRTQNAMERMTTQPIFKGVTPPLKQTPGRAQWYYPETNHLIPENILYQVRMPATFARPKASKQYDAEVQGKIIDYLKAKFSHNLFDPEKGFHLDLTVGEIKQMMRASNRSFERAASGEIQQIVNENRELKERFESITDRVDEVINEVRYKQRALAKSLKAKMFRSDIDWTYGYEDITTFFGYESNMNGIKDIKLALIKDPNNEDVKEIANHLYNCAKARKKWADAKVDVTVCSNSHHELSTYDEASLKDTYNTHESAKKNFANFPAEWAGTEGPFDELFAELENILLPELQEYSEKYHTAKEKKDFFYSSFEVDDVYEHNPEKLKEDMCAYLSGAIVVKEHRHRYQSEQYHRYQTFMQWVPMREDMTLGDFAMRYSEALRSEVVYSYESSSPLIDANYDDFGVRKVNPINATVFYYFFSANRVRRRMAQVLLSAARYPNEKMRRAYMRFFSNA